MNFWLCLKQYIKVRLVWTLTLGYFKLNTQLCNEILLKLKDGYYLWFSIETWQWKLANQWYYTIMYYWYYISFILHDRYVSSLHVQPVTSLSSPSLISHVQYLLLISQIPKNESVLYHINRYLKIGQSYSTSTDT